MSARGSCCTWSVEWSRFLSSSHHHVRLTREGFPRLALSNAWACPCFASEVLACEGQFACMCVHVPVQVTVCSSREGANFVWTRIWLQVFMYTLVSAQTRALRKGSRAHGAFARSLACMNPAMLYQFAVCCKTLAAEFPRTRVPWTGRFCHGFSDMAIKICGVGARPHQSENDVCQRQTGAPPAWRICKH